MRSISRLPADRWEQCARRDSTVVVTRSDPRGTHLVAAGEFDLANADRLRLPLLTLLFDGCKAASVDMSAVSFLDVVAAEALFDTQQDFRTAGATLLLVNPSRQVSRILELIGFDRQLLATHRRLTRASD